MISLVALLLISSQQAFAQSSPAPKKLLVIGDSISAGYGIDQQKGWVVLLQKRIKSANLNWQVINASISGDTTSGGLSRLPGALKRTSPDLVLIELGGNDGLRGTPTRLIKENLRRMIQQIRQQNIDVAILEMRIPPNYGKKYTSAFHALYQQLASEEEVPYVPFFLEQIALKPELMQADQIHPTEQAQPMMAQSVFEALQGEFKRIQ